MEWFVDEIHRYRKKHQLSIMKVDVEHIKVLIGMLLHNLVNSYSSWRDYYRNNSGSRLTTKKISKILESLGYHPQTLFQLLNDSFKKWVVLKGNASYDEAMWPWLGSHRRTVHIERKPHPDGFKIFILATYMNSVGKYYCVFFLPDLAREPLNVNMSLDVLKNQICDTTLAVTIDSWFGMFGFIESNCNLNITSAMKADQPKHLWNVLSAKLHYRQFRCFTNGKVVATIFSDHNEVRNITTCFRVTEEIISNDANSNLALSRLHPRIMEEEVSILTNLTLSSLKNISKAMGESTGMIYLIKL